jgi:two-component system, OmpR family, phosphate regulon response regulator PhoB
LPGIGEEAFVETKKKAFIIEDNEDQNLIFTTSLQRAGYETESFYDGKKAQSRLLETVPDIVILDLQVPYVSGRLLLEQIRQDPRLAEVRVFLATADAEQAQSLESEADLVLLKPISFSQLSQLAKRFLTW